MQAKIRQHKSRLQLLGDGRLHHEYRPSGGDAGFVQYLVCPFSENAAGVWAASEVWRQCSLRIVSDVKGENVGVFRRERSWREQGMRTGRAFARRTSSLVGSREVPVRHRPLVLLAWWASLSSAWTPVMIMRMYWAAFAPDFQEGVHPVNS